MGYPDNFSFARYDEAQGTDEETPRKGDGEYRPVRRLLADGTWATRMAWVEDSEDE
jgi:hypothetical protein